MFILYYLWLHIKWNKWLVYWHLSDILWYWKNSKTSYLTKLKLMKKVNRKLQFIFTGIISWYCLWSGIRRYLSTLGLIPRNSYEKSLNKAYSWNQNFLRTNTWLSLRNKFCFLINTCFPPTSFFSLPLFHIFILTFQVINYILD